MAQQDIVSTNTDVDAVNPFEGSIDLSNIDPNTLRLMMMRATRPDFGTSFKKYQTRLAPLAYQAPNLNFFDVAAELGAAILATPATGSAFEGIGRGFSNVSARVRAAREENAKANRQIALQAANLALQDEQRAEDYLQKYSLELLKLSNDPGDLITIEFDEMIPKLDDAGQPVVDAEGQVVTVPSGVRKQATFRDNLTNRSTIDALLTKQGGVQIKSPTTVINQGEKTDTEYVKAMIKNENVAFEEARAASGVRDQVNYARSVAKSLGPSGFGPQEKFLLPFKKILVGMGLDGLIDSSKVGTQTLLNQLGVGFAMAIVGQTKGAISNREMDMFLAASPVLASTYNGFMKQLDYLERIAKRAEDYSIAYSQEADRLDDSGMSKAKQKRALDRFAASWQRNNPLFTEAEFDTLSGVSRGDEDSLRALGALGEGDEFKGISKEFSLNESLQKYRDIQAAKVNPNTTAGVRSNIASDAESLADQIARGDDTFEEKKSMLQTMLDNDLPVPGYLIQNFQLQTPSAQ